MRGELESRYGPLCVETSGDIATHGGSLRAPGGHVRARPLNANGFSNFTGKKNSVGSGVLITRAAIGAGIFHPDHAYFIHRLAQHIREAGSQCVRLLRSRPYGRDAIHVHIRDGAARTHRRVRLKRKFVGRLHGFRGARECGSRVAFFHRFFGHLGRSRSHVFVKVRLRGESGFRRRPGGFDGLLSLYGGPLGLRDDADKISHYDGLDVARNCLGRILVHAY